jgi:LemA protein
MVVKMEEDFKNSLIWKITKFGITVIISCLVIVIIFAIMADENGIDTKYNKLIFVLGATLAIAISIISSYNKIQQIKAKIPKLIADIDSVKKMRDSLVSKANRVIDKYIVHESDIMNNFADARSTNTKLIKVKNASDFKSVVESYPELKSNTAIMKLIEQLEISERTLLRNRTDYTEMVSNYNMQIHSFPFSLLRRLFKLEDIQIEKEEDDIISDEELGI